MSLIQPKPYMDVLRHRRHAVGVERRRNLSKIMLENQTFFPKPVEFEDIDNAFYEWVDKKLEITHDGKRLSTYKLFSNQKLSEYSQTWNNLDDAGNLIMNFKTITRENNPQHGDSQGSSYNIPGNRDYPMFCVPVLQENGEEAYDLYTMKQPLSVNFMYTVSIICNKYELLNKFAELMQHEFNALECYLWPNNHPMPMVIESVNDESEYSIDDRKYYAQSYVIKLMGYIIRKEDFKVTKVPSRFKVRTVVNENKGKDKKINNKNWLDFYGMNRGFDACDPSLNMVDAQKPKKPIVKIEEEIPECCNKKDNYYVNKIIKLIVEFPYCEERSVTFIIDTVIDVETIETNNVNDFVIKINDEAQNFENEVKLNVDDKVEIIITRKDEYKDSSIIIVGSDPETVIDTRIDYESQLDEPSREEDVYIK